MIENPRVGGSIPPPGTILQSAMQNLSAGAFPQTEQSHDVPTINCTPTLTGITCVFQKTGQSCVVLFDGDGGGFGKV